jgi:thiosulfate/3-mercaptopyruvate sulfurtransferase
MAQPRFFPGYFVSSLVTPTWLSLAEQRAAIEDGSLVLLDASILRTSSGYSDGRGVYESGHIPGAQFADLFTQFSDTSVGFAFAAPGPAQMQQAARSVGISLRTTVVVYDQLSGAWAARVWWLLRSYGFSRVFVLDGGLAAWQAAGFELDSGPDAGPRLPGSVSLAFLSGFFVGLDAVQALSLEPLEGKPVVCALRGSEYDKGHIPNSASLPYPALLTDRGTIDLAKARAAAAGFSDVEQVVLYCGGAINAAGLALALHEGGLPIDRLCIYDGSLSEWKAAYLPVRSLVD